MIDILLLSMPTKNMDYPALSLPALTASLKSHGYEVVQRDLNTEIRDNLLTTKALSNLRTRVLPALAQETVNNPQAYAHVNEAMELLAYVERRWSFDEIQKTKELMQKRCYHDVFSQEAFFDMALSLFQISRFLHWFFDIYIHRPTVFDDCGVPNPIEDVLRDLVKSIRYLAPKIVGFTVLDIQRRFTLWFAHRIRNSYEGKIVFGGADPSRFGQIYLERYPFIDYIFLREAEESLPQFLHQLHADKDLWDTVPGLGFREDGKIRVNQVEPVTPNSIRTPDFSGFPLDKYLMPTLPIQASRGCYWRKCKFCIHWRTYSHYYRRPVQNIVNDIQTLSSVYNTRFFHFTDDELAVDLGTSIADEILRRELNVRWLTYARLEKRFDIAVLSKWYESGARVIEWGLESASQHVIDLMCKGIRVEDVQPILNNAAQAGILNKLFCFHNYPGESVEDLKITLEFLRDNILRRKIRPFLAIRNKLFLLKGSILYEEAIADRETGIFAKLWMPHGIFSIETEYEDVSSYAHKGQLVTRFLREIRMYMQERGIFSTDDENVTMDLVVLDLIEKGHLLARSSIQAQQYPSHT